MPKLLSSYNWHLEVLGGAKLGIGYLYRTCQPRIFKLNDGRIVLFMQTPDIMNDVTEAPHVFIMQDSGGPPSGIFIGEVTDQGIVQWTGDYWSGTPRTYEDDLGYNWIQSSSRNADDSAYGQFVSGKAYERYYPNPPPDYVDIGGGVFYPLQGFNSGRADAVYVHPYIYFATPYSHYRIHRLHVDTLDVDWIAGDGLTCGWDAKEAPRNHFQGKNASINPFSNFAYDPDDNALWWIETARYAERESTLNGFWDIDSDTWRLCIRKMSLDDPYTISTEWESDPAGMPTGSYYPAALDWAWATNPATGLPNYYNSDALTVMHVQLNSTSVPQIFHRNGYIYIWNGTSLRRWQKGGTTVETLLWGTKSYGPDNLEPSTWQKDSVDSRNFPFQWEHVTEADLRYNRTHLMDVQEQGVASGTRRVTNIPDGFNFEGMKNFAVGISVSGDWLYFLNDAGSYKAGSREQLDQWDRNSFYPNVFGYENVGTRVCRINLKDLEEEAEPQRINRSEPQWETIVNSGAFIDQVLRNNKTPTTHSVYRLGGRNSLGQISALHADGDDVYVLGGFARLSMQDVLADAWPENDSYSREMNWMFVHRATRRAAFDVTLQFAGTELKGYGHAKELPPKDGPTILRPT